MKKIVLVTGASGYLGGRLCHALLDQGHHVKAFVRRTSDLSCLPSPTTDSAEHGGALELAYGDVTDYPSLLDACSDCHVIFHAAALVEPWLPDPSRFVSVNVGGLKNVLQAYKDTGGSIEKIIYTSSFFALGSTDGYVADESQIHSGKYFCTEYEKSKAMADKIALEAASSEGVPIVPVYPGVIYGPGKVTAGNVVARLIIERFNWRLPGFIGEGNDRFSFSHVDDVVGGHIATMNKGRPGERYLLTGENASFKHVFDLAATISRTNKPQFGIPLFAIEAYGWLLVLCSRLTGKLPLISPPDKQIVYSATSNTRSCFRAGIVAACLCAQNMLWVLHLLIRNQKQTIRDLHLLPLTVYVLRHQWAYSCEKAKVELNYSPRSLEEGLTEVLPWLKRSNLIKY